MDVTKKVRINTGFLIALIVSIIPMFAWKIGYSFTVSASWEIVALSLAKIGAFGGMAMFALSLILSGRYKILDSLFGGLDKLYIAHRFLGTFSLILLFIHPVSLSVLLAGTSLSDAASLWFKVSDFSVWIGAMALYLLLGLVLWSLFAKVKYETFQKVHKLLGVVFLLGALHAFLAGSILATNTFMLWYMAVLTGVAAVTYITHSLFGELLERPLSYSIVNVSKLPGKIVEIELSPNTRILGFTPGQFVYIQFDDLSNQGYHPFSISSRKNSSNLTLAIREVGDFTHQITHLSKGAKAKVKGPYGGFRLPSRSKSKQFWIAGGIGVTPFLSGAYSLAPNSRVGLDIEMIYATSDKKPYGLDNLMKIEEQVGSFNVTLFNNEIFGLLSLKSLKEQFSDFDEREIYICGPPPMLQALLKEAESIGVAHRVHFEEFSY